MKKYIVLRKIGMFSAEEVRRFDNLEDARQYQKLSQSSEEHERTSYLVAELLD